MGTYDEVISRLKIQNLIFYILVIKDKPLSATKELIPDNNKKNN